MRPGRTASRPPRRFPTHRPALAAPRPLSRLEGAAAGGSGLAGCRYATHADGTCVPRWGLGSVLGTNPVPVWSSLSASTFAWHRHANCPSPAGPSAPPALSTIRLYRCVLDYLQIHTQLRYQLYGPLSQLHSICFLSLRALLFTTEVYTCHPIVPSHFTASTCLPTQHPVPPLC